MKLKLFTGIVAIAFSLSAFGQSSQKTVEEFLKQTGMSNLFKEFDGLIQSKISGKKSSFATPEQFEQFKTIMTSGMNAKNAQKFLSEYLEKYSNEDSMKQVTELYRDPFMQEFNRIEKEAATKEKQKEMIPYFQTLKETPPNQNRVQQLVSLNKEMRTSEILVKMLQHMTVSMIKGVNYTQPKDKQIDDKEILAKMDSILTPDFAVQMSNQLVAYMLFTYKDVKDDNMNHYLEVWNSPVGKYCMKVSVDAFDYSFSQMGEIIGSSFSVLDKSKRPE